MFTFTLYAFAAVLAGWASSHVLNAAMVVKVWVVGGGGSVGGVDGGLEGPLPPPSPQAVTANVRVIIANNAITLKNFVLFFIENSFLLYIKKPYGTAFFQMRKI
jgi:hypothetical protein